MFGYFDGSPRAPEGPSFAAGAPSPALVGFVLSVLVAVVLGTVLFLSTLTAEARREFPTYVRSSIRAAAPGALHPETGSWERDQRAPLYSGRSASFLLRQCGIRIALVWTVVGVGTALILRRARRRSGEPRLKRGGALHDTRRDTKTGARWRVAASLLLGLAVVLTVEVRLLGRAWVVLYPEYLEATVLTESTTLAELASPDDDGRFAWFDIGSGGFYEPEQVAETFHDHFVVSAWAFLFMTLACTVALAVGFDRLARRVNRVGRVKTTASTKTFSIAGVRIDESKTCYHMLISGSPGSGKSTAIKDLLDQIRARKRRAIVYDVGGEYIELFFREGHDALLNPFDTRTSIWTPWAEVRQPSDCARIAASLFPPGGKDPFWADAAQQLFASLLEALGREKYATNAGLDHALRTGKVETLYQILGDTAAARFLDPNGATLASNVIATMMSKLGVWAILDDPKSPKDAFSIRSFVESNDDRWLFLSTREDSTHLMKPLLSLWCDIAATAILSLPEARTNNVFCVLDEVASLQRLPALPGLLERGRKHGVSVVLGLQAMAQLRDSYGADAAQALVAQPQTWLVLRSVDPDTARWLEQALGTAEVTETATSMNVGHDKIESSYSLHERRERIPLVLASEIASLPDFEGFVRLPGIADVFRVSFSPKERARIARPFVAKNLPKRR
jgi:type IV secretion system coupling TraD/TrwB family protein